MTTHIHAISHPEIAPLAVSDRLRHEITYFMSLPDDPGQPALPPGRYRVRADEAKRWLDDGVFYLVSPLDGEKKTEIELSEEHEALLEWLVANGIEDIELR